MRTAGAAAFNHLVDIVRAGQRAGLIRDDAPEQLALAAWALVHGLAVLTIEQQFLSSPGEINNPEHLTRMCAELLYQGLRRTTPNAFPRSEPSPEDQHHG